MDKFLESLQDNWVLVVFLGLPAQIAFMSRFIVQWLASEKAGKSVIPLAFWYLSLVGSLGLAVYFTCKLDPVGMFGQSFPCLIYIRNLVLIYRHRRNTEHHLIGEGADTAEEELSV
jgi:lipid-A-disaccharide synthase-like uncharacterized protein